MDAAFFLGTLLIVAVAWSLMAPTGDPEDAPTPEALAERQRQIDQINNTEIL